jgi:hypothetical protein
VVGHRDPIVYGVALAAALSNVKLDGWAHAQRLAELYRAAGADEQVAADELEWHRYRPEYRQRSANREGQRQRACPDQG